MVEDLRSMIEHLPRYSSSDDGPANERTLTSLPDHALLLVRWTAALRRSELVALRIEDGKFVEGEGGNVYVRRSKGDREGSGLVKGLPYGSNKETSPVTALRQWLHHAGDPGPEGRAARQGALRPRELGGPEPQRSKRSEPFRIIPPKASGCR
jgi:site-specific recombinase XerC